MSVFCALEIAGLRKSFGRTDIIRGVDLQVEKNERHAVIGPNGAGKSTFFHLISGRYRPTAGSIRLNGEEIGGMAPEQINRRGMSRSFQVTNVFGRLSVWENIRCATLWAKGYRYAFWRSVANLKDVRERTEEILTEIGLIDRRDVQASVLTYAEQRALDIGLAIAGSPEVVLLDEPTAGMSHAEAERMVQLIRKVSQKRTLLMIEHDMSVVFDLADRISVLVYGKLIASDTPEKVKADPEVQAAYLGAGAI